MAKLKIPKNVPASPTRPDGYDHSIPNEQGYVNVVENLILDKGAYIRFLVADEDDRADMLQEAAGVDEAGVKCVVIQEARTGEKIPIDDDNCLIKVQSDKKKKFSGKKPGRFTISLPEEPPDNVDYLNKYAEIIHDLYSQGTVAGKKRAHKFMFGMMLLTRCR